LRANQRWSLDFTMDALANGMKFRTANLKDDCTSEWPLFAACTQPPTRTKGKNRLANPVRSPYPRRRKAKWGMSGKA